jgi:hypothetical protein
MSLGTALSSGLQAFTAVRGEQRKQQLHDLQVERYGLLNEGTKLDNQGSRLNNRALEVKARVAEYLEPHAVRQGVAEADKAEQAVLTERATTYATEQLGRQRAGAARVNESAARVAEATEKSEVEGIRAENESLVMKADRERIEDLQDGLATAFESSGGDLHSALNNDFFTGGVASLAERSFGVEISDVQPLAGGGMRFTTQDGQNYDVSEDEALSFISDTDTIAGHLEAQAQNRLAQQAVAEEAGAIRQQHAEDTTTAAQRRMQAGEYAAQGDKLTRTLADLRARREELVAENGRVSVSDGVGTIRGGVASGVRMTDNSQQIEAIDTAIGQIKSNYQEPLSRTPDEWRSEQTAAGEYLASGDERLVASLRNLGGAANEARLVSQASGGEIPLDQAVNNRLGRGPSLASLTPTERVQDQADVAQANDTIVASVEDTFDRALETLQDSVDARELADRGMKQDDLSRVARSAWASMFNSEGHTDLISAASGSPRDRIGVQVLLAAAANDAMYQGGDAGRFIKETLRGASPAVIRMASEFTNDDAFADVPDGERLRAVDRAVQLMEQYNLNATQAKTRALQEMRDSR